MSQDNILTTPALQVDLIALDALFKRIAERGRKVRAQAVDHKEQAAESPKGMQSAKDKQKVGK